MRIFAAVSLENLRQQVAKPIFERYADDSDYSDTPEQVFKSLVDIDPTADYDNNKGGKYVPWIIRQYLKNNLDPANYTNLTDALKHFAISPKKYAHSDLGQYKTVQEFLDDAERVGNMPLTEKEKAKMLKKRAHQASTEDKEFIAEDGVWELWIPKTHAGSISLAREGGTKARWCTAYEGDDYYWRRYTQYYDDGNLYIFLNTEDPGEKYQLHFGSNSWFDINDSSLGMPAFYKFISDKPVFAKYFNVDIDNGVVIKDDKIVGIDDDVTELFIPNNIIYPLKVDRLPYGIRKIVFPDEWDKICELTNYPDLEYVYLPKSLEKISNLAIHDLPKLTTIVMPENLKYIGDGNFVNCNSLTELNIPDSVERIGRGCFNNTLLRNLRYPNSTTKVLPKMFEDNLASFNIDLNNVDTIGTRAFYGTTFEFISDLRKVTYYGPQCFKGSNLSILNLNSFAHIGSYAFAESDLSGEISLYESVDLGEGCFDDCPDLTIYWARPDEEYEFDNISKLVCSNSCKKLIAANKGYVNIETIEGEKYDAEV